MRDSRRQPRMIFMQLITLIWMICWLVEKILHNREASISNSNSRDNSNSQANNRSKSLLEIKITQEELHQVNNNNNNLSNSKNKINNQMVPRNLQLQTLSLNGSL